MFAKLICRLYERLEPGNFRELRKIKRFLADFSFFFAKFRAKILFCDSILIKKIQNGGNFKLATKNIVTLHFQKLWACLNSFINSKLMIILVLMDSLFVFPAILNFKNFHKIFVNRTN
jgi:hypothetical protein